MPDEQRLESGSVFAPFRSVTFRRIWISNVISQMGQFFESVAAGWLMVTISRSDSMVALVQAANVLPVMLFALPAGALADQIQRRRIMLATQIFMVSISLVLAICAYSAVLTPWSLLVFTFLVGAGQSINSPAWQATAGDIVSRSNLPQAVTLNSVGFNLTRSAGPALGGLVVSIFGATMAFAVNVVSYLPLIVALLSWKTPPEPSGQRQPIAAAIGAGLQHVAHSPVMLRVLLRAGIFGLTAIALTSLLPIVSRDLLDGLANVFGLMLGCFGCGAVAGAFFSSRIRRLASNETIVRMSFLGLAATVFVISISHVLLLSGIAIALAGMFWITALSLFNTSMQLAAPRWVVARALSCYQMALFGGMAIGSWIWGTISENVGVERALQCASITLVAGCVIGLKYRMPAFLSAGMSQGDSDTRTPESQ